MKVAPLGHRLDELPWSRRHSRIVLALGAGWLFDSLEVNLVGGVINPMEKYFDVGPLVGQLVFFSWLIGILVGAVVGGHLADRFGRRRLFLITLLWYACLTVLTGFSPTIWFVIGLRFLTGLGVGAEYPIVNAAIIELIPSRYRGRIGAAVMNFWPVGAVLSGVLSYLLLNTFGLTDAVSWRVGFAAGGVLALLVLLFRRGVPESPRWLASRGRHAEAEAILTHLAEPGHTAVPAVTAAASPGPAERIGRLRELLRDYRGRLALGSMLDLSEAFGYYGISAVVTLVVLPAIDIADRDIPFFLIMGNVGALVGGIVMTMFFDRLGRRRTVLITYILAAAGVGLLAAATASGSTAAVLVAYLLANAFGNAAWTSAYPTFTELFPTRVRAAGVGASVGVGRVGAAFSVLIVTSVANGLNPTAGYLLVVLFWLAGAASMLVFLLRGGTEAAGKPLDAVAETRVPEPAARG
ncbi:MAG: MFS transporter [Actinocatenispora sp.]